MRAADRHIARRKLDQRLATVGLSNLYARPPRGWVRAIREALGMTTAQLARRIGVSQSRAVVIEQSEVSGKITLESLQRAAAALDCRLVYAIIPREPLESMAEQRALRLARQMMQSTSHSMALEDQQLTRADEAQQLREMAQRLLEKSGSALWDIE